MGAPWLERIGLHRPELRAWASYDWANSAFMATILPIFPIYFAKVAATDLAPAEATRRFALATSLSILVVAASSPLLGAIADQKAWKKRFLKVFLAMGVLATGLMATVGRGDWLPGVALFALANIGVTASIVFYNSLLPHIARPGELDRVSMAGFALGYLGGGLLLAVNSAWIQWPASFGFADGASALRASFASAAVWWAFFSIPVLAWIAEPAGSGAGGSEGALAGAFRRLATTLRELGQHKDAALLLLGFIIYNDAVVTIIRMATSYGTEIGIAPGALIAAVLLIQFVAIPFSFLAGAIAGRIGARATILACLAVYVIIAILGYRLTTARQLFGLAFLVGMVQGGVQGLSRSLFATMVPRHKSAEMFGFYGVFDKFGGAMGSALIAAVIGATGSSRPAILALSSFFVIGGLLLSRVDVAAGQRAAREAEADTRAPGAASAPPG
jgi:UMF1 family MFS transporter